jgi:beta-glucosidase
VDVLFGEVNPSGRLAESFPARIEDCSAHLDFPGGRDQVEYREGLFVGYRHHDARKVAPLFPFGFGLGYTTFEYARLRLDRERMHEGETLGISLVVKNTGRVAGQEVVQLYVRDEAASVVRPEKELKGFEKVALRPGEEREVRFSLSRRAFAFWDVRAHDWKVEPGAFEILVGASSRDLRLSGRVTVEARAPAPRSYDQNTALGDVLAHPVAGAWARRVEGRIAERLGSYPPGSPEAAMVEAMSRELPLRAVVRLAQALTPDQLRRLLAVLNGEAGAEGLPDV